MSKGLSVCNTCALNMRVGYYQQVILYLVRIYSLIARFDDYPQVILCFIRIYSLVF